MSSELRGLPAKSLIYSEFKTIVAVSYPNREVVKLKIREIDQIGAQEAAESSQEKGYESDGPDIEMKMSFKEDWA